MGYRPQHSLAGLVWELMASALSYLLPEIKNFTVNLFVFYQAQFLSSSCGLNSTARGSQLPLQGKGTRMRHTWSGGGRQGEEEKRERSFVFAPSSCGQDQGQGPGRSNVGCLP